VVDAMSSSESEAWGSAQPASREQANKIFMRRQGQQAAIHWFDRQISRIYTCLQVVCR
jgi:hypothetical protein